MRQMTLASEKQTDDRIDGIHEDIKATLRVSIVPLPFLLWSKQPQLLELLWSRLRANLETRYVECAADRIRKQAARMVSLHRVAHRIDAQDISLFTIEKCRAVIDVHHYINPKLLLIVTALVEALQRHPFRPVNDPRWSTIIPKGIAAEMPAIPLLDDSWLGHDKKILLKEIRKTLQLPEISTEYVGLAYCEGYLEKAWLQLKPFARTPDCWTFIENLQLLARTLVHGLPFPLEMSWDDFAKIGMAGLEVLNWIIPFQNALPGLIVNMAALKVGMDGVEKASLSPYPV
jgi:hypothetical protein